MEKSIKEYRALLIAEHPELKQALERLSDGELKEMLDGFRRLASSLQSANSQLGRTATMIDLEPASPTKPPTLH